MIKCYARLFGLAGFFFFLGTLFSSLNMLGGPDSMLEGLVSSLFFGAAVAAVLGTVHIRKVRKLAGEKREGDIYAPAQARELRLAMEYNRAFALALHYFKEVAGFSVTGSDQTAGRISARTPMIFFRTLGNNVTADLRGVEGGTLVALRSNPVLPGGLPDYGANLKIVMDAENYLRAGEHR